MAEHRFTVPDTLPGLNEIIEAAKRHYGAYSAMKREHTEAIAWTAKAARVPRMERARVKVKWIEPNRRRDPDNVEAGIKFIMDGLVEAGVLPNDGWQHVAGIEHSFELDRDNPRVEITVREEREARAS